MLSVRSGIIIGVILAVVVTIWGAVSWFDGKLDRAVDTGVVKQVDETNAATNKVAIEGEKHAKQVNDFVDNKPISDVDKLLKDFPVTAKDSSDSTMPTLGAVTNDPFGQSETTADESREETQYFEKPFEDDTVDEKMRRACPPIWDDVLDMWIPLECEYDE